MYVGIQFEAPQGYGSFQKNVRYYFAGDRTDVIDGFQVNTVLIVWFATSKVKWQKWRAFTMILSRQEFEAALTDVTNKLRILPKQFTLPPWMEEVDHLNFDELEERRLLAANRRKAALTEAGGSHGNTCRQQVEGRLYKIATAMEQSVHILRSPNPLKAIAATSYDGAKNKHPHRIQLWFFAFVLHGQNQWALKQPTHRNGLWTRNSDVHKKKKFGRPSLQGANFGWSSAGMRDDIVNFYLEHCGLGITMRSIHGDALKKKYGCVTALDEHGNEVWIQPENKPFPSYGQFRYIVDDEFGTEYVQTQVYGKARMKSQAKFNESNQTAQYANLLEEVQVDAYHVAERPKSMHTDEPSEPLIVAVAVCVTSGAVVGVGFSLGGETGDCYRSMLFCMVAPKEYIARLYGVPPEKMNWPMKGLCPAFTSDRGPAGHRRIAERLEQKFPVKTIAPSYDGQAKAPVESTHPREVKLEGAPTWVQSKLTVPQMVKRELLRAAGRNHTKEISSRLSDQAIADFNEAGWVATPHRYWAYLEERLRTSARQMTLEAAVRAFWNPVSLPVDKDGVRLGHSHYTSAEFRKSKFQSQIGGVKNLEISAFILNIVVRTVWVEVKWTPESGQT